MDTLHACAKAFENLLPIKYHILIGRKGKAVELTVCFEAVDFHHLVGLHKLHDLRIARANREKVFSQILSGDITLYLLSTPYEYTDIYIFLDQKEESGYFFCRSFFPREEKDYTKGQAMYTLLKKEKINTSTGVIHIQYDRLSPKSKK